MRNSARLRVPLIASAVVVVPALVALSPLRDAVSGGGVTASLRLPLWYVLLAPASDVMDNLSLLSVSQHIALVSTILVAFLCSRWRQRERTKPVSLAALIGELRRLTLVVLAIFAIYGAAAGLTQRPMAALSLASQDQLAIDFHSHTNASRDARRSFTVERNWAWHRDAGFDVAFVTDHLATATRPPASIDSRESAAAGTILFFGVERACYGSHFVMLGELPPLSSERCRTPLSHASELLSKTREPGVPSASILTLPDTSLPHGVLVDAQGIELVDAAPRGLDQFDRHRASILRAAGRNHLALVAGTNNHGWGRTTAAWNVVAIPGWRAMSPPVLEVAIIERLRNRSDGVVQIIERRRVATGASAAAVALTAPALAVNIALTMSLAERMLWVTWIWGGWGLTILVRQRRGARWRLILGVPIPLRSRAARSSTGAPAPSTARANAPL